MARGFLVRGNAFAAVCVVAFVSWGCSGGGGTTETVSADSPLLIETSQGIVKFQNRTGVTLTDVSISIVPYGPGEFTRRLSRIENTGRREVSATEFRGRDGTPLNLRVTRPKLVRVKAQDATGKSYDAEVSWK
jgi:hypothetical protein